MTDRIIFLISLIKKNRNQIIPTFYLTKTLIFDVRNNFQTKTDEERCMVEA